MEQKLIAEIEKRPVLYDKTVQAITKMSDHRDEAWHEVADIINQSEADVKKRWRTLRDSFIRSYRKKKTYLYSNEMAFMISHMDPKEYKTSGELDIKDDSQEEVHVGGAADTCEAEQATPPAYTSDEHFALSCAAALSRLPRRKNAEIRLKIVKLLYEAEFGGDTS